MLHTEEENFLKRPKSEAEYLKIHLIEMDELKKDWYINAMKIWADEDHNNYAKFYLWMLEG
jgi:hypothetical protein